MRRRSEELSDADTRINLAVQVIDQYAGIDGCHHKQWVIDQVLRCLLQSDYEEWVAELEKDCESEWDTGIAP